MTATNESSHVRPPPLSVLPSTPATEVTQHEQLLYKVRKIFPSATEAQNLIGRTMFAVDIDSSPTLENLMNTAHGLRDLPFADKLARIQDLAIQALPSNSVEMASNGDRLAYDLVYKLHPLSDALTAKSGCCRYQGALFFILAREARLGSQHYMLSQRKGQHMFTVYNVLRDEEGKRHLVSIFNQTLTPDGKQRYGYPEPTHTDPEDFAKGHPYYAYFNTGNEQVTIQTPIETESDLQNWGESIQLGEIN